MIDYVRRHLSTKLLLSYLVVIVIGVVVLVSATQFSLPGAFNRHFSSMGDMMGRPGVQPGPQILPGQGGPGPGPRPGSGNVMLDLYANFRDSFNEALAYAGLAAAAAAVAVGLFFSRRVVAPLRAMTAASQRIAEGHYDERVQVEGADELGELAERFNQMAVQLEQVENMRRQLIGDVSHELRTPLTAIKGSMEGLIDGVLPATAETYEQIHRETERLSRLVDDLQELSRVQAGAYHLDVRRLAVAGLVQTIAKRLAPQAESKRIALLLNFPGELPPIMADEDRIIQVLINLLGNAINYTPEGGEVRVSASEQAGEVQISVQDNGIGIPAAHLPHIFDRFYRVDKSRSRGSGGGSGIGLTVAKYLVEAHGGRIWVASGGEGQGSTFTFSLPIAKS